MEAGRRRVVSESRASFADLFTPKLVTVLREGYGQGALRADAIAGLTVAIVALPLSMAIAIASGVSPDRGLYTAIVGGFLVSLLGGSRFQIGGPAGAFIVLVAATVSRHGIEGLLLATFMSGAMLMALGWLRLGTYIKFIPYPVTVGFTAGIAVIIFASQIHDLLGLRLDAPEPAALLPKLVALWEAGATISPPAVMVALVTVALILGLKRFRPQWPGLLIAVAAAAAMVLLGGLDVETIGSRFGGIPRTLPLPQLPALDLDLALAVLPDAIGFTLLGAIESLLSAVVADGMTGRRHRSNCELVAQGVANIGASLFGGFCVTGTIARTATNIRSGAHGPVAGMLHALFLLAFLAVAAPLAVHVPLAALAGVLVVVSWNMVERHAFAALLRSSRGDAAVLMVTLLIVVFRDLAEGIVVGVALGALLFIRRMAASVAIEAHAPEIDEDVPDSERRTAFEPGGASDPDVVVYRVSGAFFFGAASTVGSVLDRIADRSRYFVLDCSGVHFIDSTGANVVDGAVRKAERAGVTVYVAGASTAMRRMLITHGVRRPRVRFAASAGEALAAIRQDQSPS